MSRKKTAADEEKLKDRVEECAEPETAEETAEEAAEKAESGCEGCEKDAEECGSCENGAKAEDAKEADEAAQEDFNTKYLRLMADFQNYKRRTENEKSDIYARANERIVTDLLVVMDNFERALEQDTGETDGFKAGMELIFKQFKEVLEKEGLEEIEALGTDFDPNFHSAVLMEDTEEFESGKVSCVLQKGYKLKGKVIRPAAVKVAN